MSAHAEEHFAGSNKLFISIWFWLVLLTMVEIGLAYKPMPIHFMLTILLGFVKWSVICHSSKKKKLTLFDLNFPLTPGN